MTNCRSIEKNLITYLDGRASPSTRRQVEAHLEECAHCRQRAGEFRALCAVLDELPAALPSPSFDASVRGRVAAEPYRPAVWRVLMPSPRLAFAAAVLVALSVWMLSISQPGSTSQPAVTVAQAQQQGSEADFGMIMQLQTLENYDVLANFDALSELPTEPAPSPAPSAEAGK